MNTLELVREFHIKFGRPIRNIPNYDIYDLDLRVRLLKEEVRELQYSITVGDALDALTDIQYILDGTYLQLGFHRFKDAAFAEVHATNMRKLGPDGKPIIREDGKILKPEGWVPPDMRKILAL